VGDQSACIDWGVDLVTVSLVVTIAFVALDYWALTRIISKAGFSRAWIVIPLLPVVLTIACTVITYHDLQDSLYGNSTGFLGFSTGFFGFSRVGFLWDLDLISLFLNWLFFMFFAFIEWPNARGGGGPISPSGGQPGSHVTSGAPASSGTRPRGVTRDYGPTTAAPVAAPTASPSAPAPIVKHCVWCADALPGSRALFHDCGPKSRPPIFCEKCGSTLNNVGDCPTCG
jgi:hypothetical protein